MSNIEERVKKIVCEQLGAKEEDVKSSSSFVNDLGADSLDTVELVMALEEEFETEIPDEDAEKYIKIFTFLDKETVTNLINQHKEAPHTRILQKRLAQEITTMVHSHEDFENAEKASNILFSKSFKEDIKTLNETLFLDVFEGVPQAEISKADFDEGLDMIGALAAKTNFLKSNGEARRALKENSVSVNKVKVKEDYNLSSEDLINDKYIILNKGKRNTYIIKIV